MSNGNYPLDLNSNLFVTNVVAADVFKTIPRRLKTEIRGSVDSFRKQTPTNSLAPTCTPRQSFERRLFNFIYLNVKSSFLSARIMAPPNSRKSSSRRSSILKTPKPRHPLQSVNFNSSSTENTPPTSKLKRRVSFAEKKHVKEFCNSIEQGTVWDSTYEEQDTSNVKVPNASDKGDAVAQIPSKENVPGFEPNNEFNLVGVQSNAHDVREYGTERNNSYVCGDKLAQEDLHAHDCDLNFTNCVGSMDQSCAPVSQEKILETESRLNIDISARETIKVYEDENNGMPANRITDCFSQPAVNETVLQDVPAELAKFVSKISQLPTMQTRLAPVFNAPEEIPRAVPVSVLNMEQSHYPPLGVQNHRNIENTATQYFNDNAMQFTECVGSLKTQIIDQSPRMQNPEEFDSHRGLIAPHSTAKEAAKDTLMEFTVPLQSIFRPVTTTASLGTARCFVDDDRTKVFQDTSMEITSAVPAMCNRSSISYGNQKRGETDERTTHFRDVSMEMTKAIENMHRQGSTCENRKARPSRQSIKPGILHSDEKTRLLDMSMEMTRAVPVNMQFMERDVEANAAPSMITLLPNTSRSVNTTANLGTGRFVDDDRTRVFQDASMEVTSAVMFDRSSSPYCNEKHYETDERTTYLHDVSMEITKAVENMRRQADDCQNTICSLSKQSINPGFLCSDERSGSLNTSMEMTEVVSINMQRIESDEGANASSSMITSLSNTSRSAVSATTNLGTAKCLVNDERTKVFQDVSMEMTSAVPVMCNRRSVSYGNQKHCETDERTTQFHDITMEITKAIESMHRQESTCENRRATLSRQSIKPGILHSDEKTRLLDMSMEMTSAVPINMQRVEREEEFVVMDNHSDTCTVTTSHEKTRVYNEEAMEFTKAVTALPKTGLNIIQSNTPIDSAPSLQRDVDDFRLTNCRDTSASNVESTQNRNKIFQNNSVTTTEVIPAFNVRGNYENVTCNANLTKQSVDNRIVSVPNESMDVAKVVPETLRYSQSRLDLMQKLCDIGQPPFPDNNHQKRRSSIATDLLLNLDPNLDKENCNIKRSLRGSRKSTLVENTSSNPRVRVGLHEFFEQNTSASALNTNNVTESCLTKSPEISGRIILPSGVSEGTSHLTTSILNDKCLNDHSQCTVTAAREMCTEQLTIATSPKQKSCADLSITSSSLLISDNLGTPAVAIVPGNDNSYREMNDKECHPHSSLKDIGSEATENHEQPLTKTSSTLSNESVECLEEIQQPSFLDLMTEEALDNVNCNLESCENTYKDILSASHTEAEKSQGNQRNHDLMEGDKINRVLERMRKSQTFIIKRFSSDVETGNLAAGSGDHNFSLDETNPEEELSACSLEVVKDKNDKFEALRDGRKNCINDEAESCVQDESYDTGVEIATTDHCINNESKESFELCRDSTEKEPPVVEDPFSSFINELKVYAKSDDIIWDVYQENINRKMVAIGFMACSLLVVILADDYSETNTEFVKGIKLISRLADDAGTLITIVHRLILEKIDTKELLSLYKKREDVPPLLDYVSKEVKLAMDFMFDLKRLDDSNLMEINCDRISFESQTRRMDIILKITIDVKPFEKIGPCDITVHCLLGSVSEEVVKKLIRHVKRDHKFLRRYMSDVSDYINLMEGSGNTVTRPN